MSRTAIRTLILQAVILVGIALVIATIAKTTFANLDRLGVQSGFDFLWYRSGFDIGQKLLPYSSNSPIYMAFFVSVLNTLLLSFFTSQSDKYRGRRYFYNCSCASISTARRKESGDPEDKKFPYGDCYCTCESGGFYCLDEHCRLMACAFCGQVWLFCPVGD